jgi:aspartate/methionine/tyrosine aminotransferase
VANPLLPAHDASSLFRLKPIQVARVSEISETTADAPVPAEERVNFHIGNPLQDVRLSSAFLRTALGINILYEEFSDEQPEAILEALGWQNSERPKLDFFIRTIQKSSPYMPRGGYNRKSPHTLIQSFRHWLEKQQEALYYDSGEQSGKREIILASGGLQEVLRVLFFALSTYLEVHPARILCYQIEVLPAYKTIPNLEFYNLAANEQAALQQAEEVLLQSPQAPTFLVVGAPLSELTRRSLRILTIEQPLMIIEANNSPNHLSLAREAKLAQRVIRLLTPAIFSERLDNLSVIFIAGNADILNLIENVHFNLKGTPSASEIELLIYLIKQSPTAQPQTPERGGVTVVPAFEGFGWNSSTENALPNLAHQVEYHLEKKLTNHSRILNSSFETLEKSTASFSGRLQSLSKEGIIDEFANIAANQLFDLLIHNIDQQNWIEALLRSFLSAFVKQQPQYMAEACQVASGSSRTALAILGKHCGITEVVIADLSWSYEQCFPVVHVVPLQPSLELNIAATIQKIELLCQRDPGWRKKGAVVINNPHNATGRIFHEEAVRKLVAYCLQHQIYIIDDLAYQNVAPVDNLPEIKTVRQIASHLIQLGLVDEQAANLVITAHSMSKADCLAGARLAVIEIRDPYLRHRFEAINSRIQPNLAAVFLCYLFYRGDLQAVRAYWRLRNKIFYERTQVLIQCVRNLPPDRNPFCLSIIPPTGSMYPLLIIERLPPGLSLDWLASSLARRGIGLLPLATFARTEKGFETGRKAFRLTLGGVDSSDILAAKTRRLLIDLNRLIAEEDARYNRNQLVFTRKESNSSRLQERSRAWEGIAKDLLLRCSHDKSCLRQLSMNLINQDQLRQEFFMRYAPQRLEEFHTRLIHRASIHDELIRQATADNGLWLSNRLEQEFMKDSLQRRQDTFKQRAYDRTVHPTQMYALETELAFDAIITALISNQTISPSLLERAAKELSREYFGLNVPVTSQQEANEIILDLASLSAGEDYACLFSSAQLTSFISFWSDWDGSNRPSGQGHVLIAALVMENVQRMSAILNLLRQVDPTININPDLLAELKQLPQKNQRFIRLLSSITGLTHQLERRYRGILPFQMDSSPLQELASKWHLRRDPVKTLWQHNDRYEQKMLDLRQQRRNMLEFYFMLNKKLRKQLYALIPAIQTHRFSESLLSLVVGYHDLLQRAVITPRIQQAMITARDQFAIDTTVYNMHEINSISGTYGNPGMTLALQISLSSKPEFLVTLDRKMRTQAEQARRKFPAIDLPSIWLIPLFEEVEAVKNIPSYLEQIWDYANQSQSMSQTPQIRFSEIVPEIFIAGSDLCQHVSQPAGAFLYRKAKFEIHSWLAEHGVADKIRLKIGSGEPMQRQGAYYAQQAGVHAFLNTDDTQRRLYENLPEAARRSADYAITPLQGVFLGGDLRTFQSNLSEKLRFLPPRDLVSLLYHVRTSQKKHRSDLIRAAESMAESRMGARSRSVQELERLTIGASEPYFEQFLEELTDNFRHILYGRQEDVVGIHIISYFIGRSIPQLRDRPTSRRSIGAAAERGQRILANIAEIIPLSRQGSLLRAITHNQAQTAVLGVNQLSTGLFRALERFAQRSFTQAEQERMLAERILPQLPVYEILNSLRLYHDRDGKALLQIEMALPAGNSALFALREDNFAMQRFLPLLQQELLRRHGVTVSDFLTGQVFNPKLLPTLRPDLAVLMQGNLFNTNLEAMLENVSGKISDPWQDEVSLYLKIPEIISYWRSLIWDTIGGSVFQRVQSFTELATALHTFTSASATSAAPLTIREAKLSPALSGFFRSARADDEMRQFLVGAIGYLNSLTESSLEIPVSIIRAMNDVERLAQIEESLLPIEQQNLLRFCILQIARLAGENG